jgi:exopolyphosphatase/guanosine-5'-triphosphate,3'-diphosphate pyrophosphatase
VIDIGGGSVEIAVGDGENSDFVESLPLGFLRLAQVVGAREAAAASEAVRARVLSGSVDVAARLRALRPDAWVFSGGTARALGKLLIAGPSGVTGATVRHVARELGKTRPAQLLQLGVDETRVDTLALGAAVFGALVEQFALSTLHVSSGGLREGMLLRELSRARLVAASSAPVRDVQLASAPAWAL